MPAQGQHRLGKRRRHLEPVVRAPVDLVRRTRAVRGQVQRVGPGDIGGPSAVGGRVAADGLHEHQRPVGDAVRLVELGLFRRQPLRIGEALGDPQPAAIVERHGDGLMHVRLAGEQRDAEAVRRLEALHGLCG